MLVHGLTGRVDIVVSEEVVDEVLRVLEDQFADHPAFLKALERLPPLVAAFELVPRTAYQAKAAVLKSKVRDSKDAPLLAGALAGRADCLVSGDKDLLVLQIVEGIPIRRTRDILAIVERGR